MTKTTGKVSIKDLVGRAAKRNDQTQTKTGSGEFTPPAAGKTSARFVDYIEVGMQKQKPYKGKEKAPAAKVYVTFELLGKNNIRQITKDDNSVVEVADRITVPLTLSLHEKAAFKKLFKKMTYGRQEIVHMAQMLGEEFRVTVVHNETGEGDSKRVYANITDEDGNFLVESPFKIEEDEDGNVIGKKKIPVRPALSPIRLFLWDEPTDETWASLFIDGDREVKDDKGKTKTVSKNWIQNMITSAVNFEGSPIQAFLEGSSDLPEDPESLEDEEFDDEDLTEQDVEDEEYEEEVVEEPKTKKVAKAATKAPAKAAAPAKKTSKADDSLRELGLLDD